MKHKQKARSLPNVPIYIIMSNICFTAMQIYNHMQENENLIRTYLTFLKNSTKTTNAAKKSQQQVSDVLSFIPPCKTIPNKNHVTKFNGQRKEYNITNLLTFRSDEKLVTCLLYPAFFR